MLKYLSCYVDRRRQLMKSTDEAMTREGTCIACIVGEVLCLYKPWSRKPEAFRRWIHFIHAYAPFLEAHLPRKFVIGPCQFFWIPTYLSIPTLEVTNLNHITGSSQVYLLHFVAHQYFTLVLFYIPTFVSTSIWFRLRLFSFLFLPLFLPVFPQFLRIRVPWLLVIHHNMWWKSIWEPVKGMHVSSWCNRLMPHECVQVPWMLAVGSLLAGSYATRTVMEILIFFSDGMTTKILRIHRKEPMRMIIVACVTVW